MHLGLNRDEGTCQECGKHFNNIRAHIRTVHQIDELKPAQCTQCNKGFPNKSHLRDHMAIHSEERPHSCRFCDFASKTKGNLTKHEKQRHPVDFVNARLSQAESL